MTIAFIHWTLIVNEVLAKGRENQTTLPPNEQQQYSHQLTDCRSKMTDDDKRLADALVPALQTELHKALGIQ